MQQYMLPKPRGNGRTLSITQHFLLVGLDTYEHIPYVRTVLFFVYSNEKEKLLTEELYG